MSARGFLNNAPAPADFLKWLEDSGLKWENELRQLVETPPENVVSILKSLVEHDLKGLTEKIIDIFSAEMEKSASVGTHAISLSFSQRAELPRF